MSIKNIMELIAIPIGFILWYLAYEAKPYRKDEAGIIWEQENLDKRSKIKQIFDNNLL
tara:strand:+ start:9926 stop:10099 length:174 start_codon:yes stop_codon:yes gene_type:complete